MRAEWPDQIILGTGLWTARPTSVVEVLIGPDSKALYRLVGRLHWRRRSGAHSIVLHRNGTAVVLRSNFFDAEDGAGAIDGCHLSQP
ncbi:hypothetical protein P775_09855 [Puniceibacterium antarcticum]|uniref:Uncharacterized protein n=1 Tax=Puniceibacterium antarcticum TaxID=1206336 RepID=A0A2G8RF89_9RHOB|nr:hypothetical protein P775_09855 [Puniceibacterium antarcticum]